MNAAHAILQLDTAGIDLGVLGDDLVLIGNTKSLPDSLRTELSLHKAKLRHELNGLRAPSLRGEACVERCRFYLPSHGQQRLSFLDALYPKSAAYVVSASVFFRGVTDQNRLVDALRNVVGRHDALYTHLIRTDDIDLAAIDRNVPVDLPLMDLSGHPDQAERLSALCETISTTPFDLTDPPLWRWLLVRTGESSFNLIVAIHHFISDGWSLAAAFRELATEYRLGAPRSEAPSAGYSLFARQQRRRLAEPDIPALIEDARNALSACRLESSTFDGKVRPELDSDRAGRLTFSLSPEVARAVRALAGELSLTVSSILAAMFALTIDRFTEGGPFALGIAASNRPGSRFENIFGFFVNWLAVPVDCGRQETLASLIKRFHADKLAAIDRVCIPFDEIARTSGASRTPFLHPVFQFMFVSHVPARAVSLPGIEVSLLPLPNGRAKLDLTMFLTDSLAAVSVEGEGELFLEIEYNAQLFNPDLIDRFSQDFRSLVETAAAVGDTTLAQLAPRRQPSIAKGRIVKTAPDVVAMFERVVARTPHAPAVLYSGESLTYRDLRDRAAQIAAALLQLDCGERRIALLVQRGFELPAALIGSAMANATFVTLDPEAPPERNRRIIADAKPGLMLYSGDCVGDAAALAPDTVCRAIEEFGFPPAGGDPFDTRVCRPDHAAYLLYTSGSSGVPKGALIPHRAVANFAAWMGDALNLSQADRVLAKTPISFDAFLRETLMSLCHGTCVIMADDRQALDVNALVELIDDNAVTVLHATPTLYDELLGITEGQGSPALRSLSRVMCGGEALPRTLVERHFRLLPDCRLFNVYGPTECTVDVTCKEIRPETGARVTLGRPIDNCMIIIADEQLEPVERGRSGEIVIAGTPVGLGYLGAAAGSAFLDPFPHSGGQRAYRTGDMGRMLPDGEIEYLGRRDRQIKIRGMRIECGEVEQQIEAHPVVERCVVVASDGAGQGAELLAAVRLVPGARQDARTLTRLMRSYLSDYLPLAMIPNLVAPMAAFPRTAHGKLDASALARELRACREDANARTHAPSQPNAIETEIIAMAEALLGQTGIAVHDNFFDRGGHSLNAIRLINQANKRFGTTLTVKELFNEPTISALAAAIAASAGRETGAGTVIRPIRRRRRPSAMLTDAD
ncbi:amino acid adenylation domain-containing protein [Sphingomonas sp. QA11]|uniref:non-ribosomal peptide synthetase n=1 Tax=Sphingomonas sp. QA11 TaxID=2950605 RepID=UPI00234B8AF4|nr:amino acid adenylation domain-containing protein [Sphingomonas sp. QA11]WCM26234.1 amino acid adenylation domain-containing protein [Sphingomonas sp. QA11]